MGAAAAGVKQRQHSYSPETVLIIIQKLSNSEHLFKEVVLNTYSSQASI
jgi:hypothetical protein